MYQQTTAEEVETVTVLPSVNAAGQREPCAITFKEQRLNSDLEEGTPADSCVSESEKFR